MEIKKYQLLICLLFSIMTMTVVNGKKLPLSDKIIFVDPGHGGRDPGTRYGRILEKDLNLEISKVLKQELEKNGAKVILAREEDIDLSKETDYNKKHGDLNRRIHMLEKNKSDLYLSIHLNWYNDYYYGGAEVLYNNINSKNKLLAEAITNSLEENRIKTREIRTTNLYLYRNTKVPGVLLECGFLSNSNDRYLLQKKDYQEKFSKIIVEGLIDYFTKEDNIVVTD